MTTPHTGMIFKLGDGVHPMIKKTLEAQGWVEFDPEKHKEDDWNLHWKSSRFSVLEFRDVQPWQRLNHFQGSIDITRKDRLCRMVRKMTLIHGKTYNFVPMSFVLPTDMDRFRQEFQERESDETANHTWICKPSDSSRGRGIFLLRRLEDLDYSCSTVVQEYIERPLTVNGYKMDMRLYVLVTSFRPLVVYAYREGIARFGTSQYDMSNLEDLYCHLTNTSINKHNPRTRDTKQAAGAGCKWTLGQLREHFRAVGIDDARIWRRISTIIIYTLLCLTGVKQQSSCFELYGFDVLLDSRLKPWLLEVNFSPALGLDCQQDRDVKIPLIQDIVKVLDYGATGTKPSRRPVRRTSKTQPHVPVDVKFPYEIGNFVRIFPFNRSTLEESGKARPNVKRIISEVKRVYKAAREADAPSTGTASATPSATDGQGIPEPMSKAKTSRASGDCKHRSAGSVLATAGTTDEMRTDTVGKTSNSSGRHVATKSGCKSATETSRTMPATPPLISSTCGSEAGDGEGDGDHGDEAEGGDNAEQNRNRQQQQQQQQQHLPQRKGEAERPGGGGSRLPRRSTTGVVGPTAARSTTKATTAGTSTVTKARVGRTKEASNKRALTTTRAPPRRQGQSGGRAKDRPRASRARGTGASRVTSAPTGGVMRGPRGRGNGMVVGSRRTGTKKKTKGEEVLEAAEDTGDEKEVVRWFLPAPTEDELAALRSM